MFPFKQLGDGSFQPVADPQEEEEVQVQDPVYYSHHQQQQPQDLIVDNELLAAVKQYTGSSMRAPADRGRGRGRGPARARRVEDDDQDKESRMQQHRDIERQRRQEMASLLTHLRSLLPLQYLKGKRSMSDHIEESGNYIRQLQGRIKDLRETREQLLQNQASSSSSSSSQPASNSKYNVEVFMSSGSLQVQITCEASAPLLSKSLKLLLDAGLDIVSCVTNQIDTGEALLHSIHCQVTDVAWNETDVHNLKQRLYQLLSSSSSSSNISFQFD